MTPAERNAFHRRKAYAHVRAVIRELNGVQDLNPEELKILRQMYTAEDTLWQFQDTTGGHNYGKFV